MSNGKKRGRAFKFCRFTGDPFDADTVLSGTKRSRGRTTHMLGVKSTYGMSRCPLINGTILKRGARELKRGHACFVWHLSKPR